MSCGSQAPAPEATTPPKDDKYYDDRNRDDKDRGSVLDRSKKRYSGPKCEGDNECEEQCKDIYNRRSVREDCVELAVAQVEKLWEIFEIFESPKDDELLSIDAADFEIFVEIDNRPLDTLISKLSKSEAKRVLAWAVDEPDIAEVFEDEDDEYRLLKELLDGVSSDPKVALGKNISGPESFIEIAASTNKGTAALDWIHSFFSEECDEDNKGEEVCVFQDWYCEIVKHSDDDVWDDVLGYDTFAQIIDSILEDYDLTGKSWWEEGMESDELTINQLTDLCNDTLEEKD